MINKLNITNMAIIDIKAKLSPKFSNGVAILLDLGRHHDDL
jgi:hypothetical protein